MNLKKTYTPKIGYTKLCETEKCSCKRLEFGMIELNAGDSVTVETEGKEFSLPQRLCTQKYYRYFHRL